MRRVWSADPGALGATGEIMGDWIVRTHWAIAPDEVTALAAYERLEEIAGEIRREGDFESGTSILRFGSDRRAS